MQETNTSSALRWGKVNARSTYCTAFNWAHIKEAHRALGDKKAPSCCKFIQKFWHCFSGDSTIDNNVGCTAIAKQGWWCGVQIYGLMIWRSNHDDLAAYLKFRDVSLLCCNPTSTQGCGLNVYTQLLEDDGKVKGINKNHPVASFKIVSTGSIMMHDLVIGCSSEGFGSVPLIFLTTNHKKPLSFCINQ